MYIWEKVVDLKMIMLREIASEGIIQTLSTHMPDFLQMYKREFTARKSSDGETRAVRWIMDRLQKSKDGRWPGTLLNILQCNDALLDEVRREFWKIHDEGRSYSSFSVTTVRRQVTLYALRGHIFYARNFSTQSPR